MKKCAFISSKAEPLHLNAALVSAFSHCYLALSINTSTPKQMLEASHY